MLTTIDRVKGNDDEDSIQRIEEFKEEAPSESTEFVRPATVTNEES